LLVGAIALIALFLATMPYPRLRHHRLAQRRRRVLHDDPLPLAGADAALS
jgi:hypothetical protein